MFTLAVILLCIAERNGMLIVPLWCKILLCIPIVLYIAAMLGRIIADLRDRYY